MSNNIFKCCHYSYLACATVSLMLFAFGLSASAQATSCFLDAIISSQDDPAEFVDSVSDVIFVGTAIEKWTENYSNIDGLEYVRKESTVFKVDAVEKGDIDVDEELLVVGTLLDCSCVKGFVVGQRYRVVVSIRKSYGKDSNIVQYCNYIIEIGAQ